jgi:hypothetical protein
MLAELLLPAPRPVRAQWGHRSAALLPDAGAAVATYRAPVAALAAIEQIPRDLLMLI